MLKVRIINHAEVLAIDGPPRSKLQLHCRRGALFGEARKDANTEPVLYGLLRDSFASLDTSEPARSSPNDNMDNCDADADLTPSKKKKKKEGTFPGQKPSKSGPDDSKGAYSKSPAMDRVPLPKLSKTYLDRRRFLRREIASLRRSALQQDSDPGTTAIFYTVCNAQAGESALAIRRGGVPSMSFSEDLGLLAVGFGSGRIRVWSLGAESLRQMMPPDELALLDMDDDRIRSKMLHDENDETHPARDLLGHQGAVHGVAFSPDGQLVASASADGSLRLWSTVLWGGTLTAWRDHVMPIWSVAWPPAYGHYLATGGSDRTARLYACDHAPGPLRVFCGHQADVTTVSFHPNVNYLATGSADRAVRLFDIRSGKAVRLYTGHKGSVQSLAFSPCGRYLASGGWCGAICLWDIGRGGQVGQLGGYSALTTTTTEEGEDSSSRQLLTGPVVALHFCPSGSGQLAAAGLEGAVRVWNTGTGQLLSQQTAPEGSHTAPAADSASTNGSGGGGGLLAAHNALSDVYQRNPNRSGREWRQTAETYYSAAGSYEVSRTCLRDAFFTRKTSVLAVQFAHPYMLLAAGPYNQA
ncbi:Transcription initiation factor TFIID subunit 5 [Sparganum proliferum]